MLLARADLLLRPCCHIGAGRDALHIRSFTGSGLPMGQSLMPLTHTKCLGLTYHLADVWLPELRKAAAAAAAAGQPTGGAAWSGAQDLASLHEQRQQQRARQQHASISNIEDMLSKTGLPEDSWGFAELGLVVGAAVVGAVAYAKWQAHRGGRAGVKSHNGRRD